MASRIKITAEGWRFLSDLLKAAGYATQSRRKGHLSLRRLLKLHFYQQLYPGATPQESPEGVAVRIKRLNPKAARHVVSDDTLEALSRLPAFNDPHLHNTPAGRLLFGEVVDSVTGRIDYLRFFRRLTSTDQVTGVPKPICDTVSFLELREQPPLENASPLTINIQVLVAATPSEGVRSFCPIAESHPVKGGQALLIKANVNRPVFLYALWVTPSGKVQPIYPWSPGIWERKVLEKESPCDLLELPTKDSNGNFELWEFGELPGIESLVVFARTEPLPRTAWQQLRDELGGLPEVNSKQVCPSPFHHFFGGNQESPVRLKFRGKFIPDPARLRCQELESRLSKWCIAGACLSFFNAG